MVLFRVWTEGGRQQKTPGAETPGINNLNINVWRTEVLYELL